MTSHKPLVVNRAQLLADAHALATIAKLLKEREFKNVAECVERAAAWLTALAEATPIEQSVLECGQNKITTHTVIIIPVEGEEGA